MKECCRNVLAELDARKRGVKFETGLLFIPSLADILGDKTIPEARMLLPGGGTGGQDDTGLQEVTREICAKLSLKHADEHESRKEKMEAAFWRDVANATHAAHRLSNYAQEKLKTAADQALQNRIRSADPVS